MHQYRLILLSLAVHYLGNFYSELLLNQLLLENIRLAVVFKKG